MQNANKPIVEAVLEVGESISDVLVEDEFLSAIPIVGTAVKLLKARDDFRSRAFSAKLVKFIEGIDKASPETRKDWNNRTSDSVEDARYVGETLFLVLEDLNDLSKPEMLAKIFIGFTAGVVSVEEFRRLAHAIDVGFSDDLQNFVSKSEIVDRSEDELLRSLLPTGLTRIVSNLVWSEVGSIPCETSSLGVKLRDLVREGG